MTLNSNQMQVISNGKRMGLILSSTGTIILDHPFIKTLIVEQSFDHIPMACGDYVQTPRRDISITLELGAAGMTRNENPVSLIDLGILENMTVRQLFDAINKKLAKRQGNNNE